MKQENGKEKSSTPEKSKPTALDAKKRTLEAPENPSAEPDTKMKKISTSESAGGKHSDKVHEPEGHGKIKWHSLEHRGVLFSDPYAPFGLKLKIKVIFEWKRNREKIKRLPKNRKRFVAGGPRL